MNEFAGNVMRQAADKVTKHLIRVVREVADVRTRQLRDVSTILDRNTRNLQAADPSIARRLESVIELRPPAQPASLLRPDGKKYPLYTPSEAELELGSRRLVSMHPESKSLTLSPDGKPTLNGVHIWLDEQGRLNVYKPFAGEVHNGHDWLPREPGALAKREVAAYRVINMFSPNKQLVPTTALLEDGPLGPGMIQEFMPLKSSKRWSDFQKIDRQTAAAGHHIIGNYDGHHGNFRPLDDGNPKHSREDDMVLFDHGYSFPESPDSTRGKNGFSYKDSVLVQEYYRHPNFDPEVIRNVTAVSPEQIGSAIQDLVSEDAIKFTLNRHSDFIQYKTIQFI